LRRFAPVPLVHVPAYGIGTAAAFWLIQRLVAMDTVISRYGKLNVLANNAGIAPPGSMDMSF